jgi:AcrR family transcriptional regulator
LWQNGFMTTKARRAPRRTEALSREVIVQAATEILDAGGEDALTLRALTVRLATGYGAIYHHVADRDDLLAAATDHIIARIVTDLAADAEPRPALRSVAAGLFDAIVAHPWAGAQLNRDPLRPALLDIYEIISRQLQALDVPQRALSDSAGVLVSYIPASPGRTPPTPGRSRAARWTGQLSSPPSPHGGRSSTPPDTHPYTKPGQTCSNMTTACSSWPASTSSSPASRP